jgi:hypothetical protein
MSFLIWANIITYNEEDTIALAMRSVEALVDGYWIVDGRFKGFSEGSPIHSTDRTLEIAKRFPNVRIEVLTEVLPECDKRNVFSKSPADWNVIVDAHALWLGDLRRLKHELGYWQDFRTVDIECFPSTNAWLTKTGHWYSFVWNSSSGFHFGNHHWMHLGKDGNVTERKGKRVDYVKILYLSDLLSKERKQLKDAYLLWRSKNPNERW